MSIALKQSTASQEVPLGYFLDSTDGNTEETGLTIANTDIKLWKNGATTLANKNSGGATHISNGIYYAVLDATDTNTVGPMVIFVHVSGALAVRVECHVYEEAIYDALYGASAAGFDANGRVDIGSWLGTAVTTSSTTSKPEVDVHSISDDATAANNAELDYDGTGYAKANSTIGTCTTNTDMRGTDSAATAAALATAQADLDTITGTDGVTLATAQALYAPAKAGDAMALVTDAWDAAAVADDGVDAVLDEVVEGTTTLRQMQRGFASALLAKAAGLDTTSATFRDLADLKNRITATVDASGNRTAVTLDLT